jgi:hypothetical protein
MQEDICRKHDAEGKSERCRMQRVKGERCKEMQREIGQSGERIIYETEEDAKVKTV